jgi:hypothetical protein
LNPLKGQQNKDKVLPLQQTEKKVEQETMETKPFLKPEAVQVVFNCVSAVAGTAADHISCCIEFTGLGTCYASKYVVKPICKTA